MIMPRRPAPADRPGDSAVALLPGAVGGVGGLVALGDLVQARARPRRGSRTARAGAARRTRRGSPPCGASGRRRRAPGPSSFSSRAAGRPPQPRTLLPGSAPASAPTHAPDGFRKCAVLRGVLPRAAVGHPACHVRSTGADELGIVVSRTTPGSCSVTTTRRRPATGRTPGWPPSAWRRCCRSAPRWGRSNLFIDGVLRPGPIRAVYAGTMLLLALLGGALAVLRRVNPATTATLVVVGDVVYVIVALSTTNPLLYASPLMLLFCCAAAAWFLGPRMLVGAHAGRGGRLRARAGAQLSRHRRPGRPGHGQRRRAEPGDAGGLPAPAPRPAAAHPHPGAVLHRPADRAGQPARRWWSRRRGSGGRPAATGSGWPPWCSTWTTSSGSTTPSGTPSGTPCCAVWPQRSAPASARRTCSPAPAGRSWWCWAWSPTPARPGTWPSGCGWRWRPVAPGSSARHRLDRGRAGRAGLRGHPHGRPVAAGGPGRRRDVPGQAERAGPGGAGRSGHRAAPADARRTDPDGSLGPRLTGDGRCAARSAFLPA